MFKRNKKKTGCETPELRKYTPPPMPPIKPAKEKENKVMTNLEIIKYLATNNPTRLAVLLDDIYCCAWNCGAYAQRFIDEDKISSLEMEFSESEWLAQEANTDFFFDDELEEWSKFIEKENTK